tara:strand:- start:1271 stop:2416 length:1146 start_codon:yes stop_codon:yes gene_type:complete
MKKIAVLVLNDYNNDSRVIKEVMSLSKSYQVDVYATNDGLSKIREDISKNITIFKHIKYIKPSNYYYKKILQLITYIKFSLNGLFNLKSYDFIHCNDLETLPIGVVAKIFYNKKYLVYDAHEYETETLWMQNKFKKNLAKKIERFCLKYVDKTITVSNAIADEYVKIYNIEKPSLVLNTPPYENIDKKNIFRDTFKISNDKTIFLYQGGMTNGRGIEILLDTFKLIEDGKSVIVFMGFGPLERIVIESSKEYSNIFFHKAVSPAILLDYTSSADFGILFYENNCLNHYYCSPNKIFEYLMAGIPVIVSNLFEMKRLVENNRIGVVSKGNSPIALKAAIEIANTMDRQKLLLNIEKVKKVYNWEEQEQVLMKLYSGLLNEKK